MLIVDIVHVELKKNIVKKQKNNLNAKTKTNNVGNILS